MTQEEGPLTEEFSKINDSGVFILKLPAWRKLKNIFRRSHAIKQISRIVREHNIGLIYANTYRLNPYALKVSSLCKIKCITHIHDIIKPKHLRHFLLHKSRYLVVPSKYVSDTCLKGCGARVFVLHNGIEVDKIASVRKGKFRQEFNIPESALLVTMVANFVERKGHKLFIDAASVVRQKLENTMFAVVGDSIYGGNLNMADLKKYADNKGLGSCMVFTGLRSDVANILRDSQVFVLPSEKEPFSLAVVEAMSAGAVVLAHKNSGGPLEIVDDCINGEFVDCSRANEFGKAIIKLLKDDSLREKLSRAALEKARASFDLSLFVENARKILKEVSAG